MEANGEGAQIVINYQSITLNICILSNLTLVLNSCLALRIHVSPYTKEILDTFGTFELELRGEIELKVFCFYLN
jgi:hypothetical protein